MPRALRFSVTIRSAGFVLCPSPEPHYEPDRSSPWAPPQRVGRHEGTKLFLPARPGFSRTSAKRPSIRVWCGHERLRTRKPANEVRDRNHRRRDPSFTQNRENL